MSLGKVVTYTAANQTKT